MARKTSLEVANPTLVTILAFTENLEAGLQRYTALNRSEEPMDVSPLENVQHALQALEVGQQRLQQQLNSHQTTRREDTPRRGPAAREGQQAQQGLPSRANQQARGKTCYLCDGPHMAYACPELAKFRQGLHKEGATASKN